MSESVLCKLNISGKNPSHIKLITQAYKVRNKYVLPIRPDNQIFNTRKYFFWESFLAFFFPDKTFLWLSFHFFFLLFVPFLLLQFAFIFLSLTVFFLFFASRFNRFSIGFLVLFRGRLFRLLKKKRKNRFYRDVS